MVTSSRACACIAGLRWCSATTPEVGWVRSGVRARVRVRVAGWSWTACIYLAYTLHIACTLPIPCIYHAYSMPTPGCWVVMDGMVFDLEAWLPEHPGGATIIPMQALKRP